VTLSADFSEVPQLACDSCTGIAVGIVVPLLTYELGKIVRYTDLKSYLIFELCSYSSSRGVDGDSEGPLGC
jgi:hypothetical protein